MNEMELSGDLVAREVAHEAVACGILVKTAGGYLWRGDKHDWIVTISAHKAENKPTRRIREEETLGYN